VVEEGERAGVFAHHGRGALAPENLAEHAGHLPSSRPGVAATADA
jgi:hypothetical protein